MPFVYIIDSANVSLSSKGQRGYQRVVTTGSIRGVHHLTSTGEERIRRLLRGVKSGRISVAVATRELAHWPMENTGFARIDFQRSVRQGLPEAILCTGKKQEHVKELLRRLVHKGEVALATRVPEDWGPALEKALPDGTWHREARLFVKRPGSRASRRRLGPLLIAAAGTADRPVAEEAAFTAEAYGVSVDRLYDVGVAGLHRLLSETDALTRARVIVVVAGMDGALPSVVGGLVRAPVIAVPTSVGYGASFGGITALLTMLNSCSPGVVVVNIDNGYGAAVAACRILLGRR